MLTLNRTRFALLVRVSIALLTRTFFQPDEYYQALEPAHHLVFGYGHLTWEWLAQKPIRSIVYPALNVPIYLFLRITGVSEYPALGDWLMIVCPKILHGALAAAADVGIYELAQRTLGNRYASTAYLLSITSLFNALSLSRSLSNSLETSLSTLAFSNYPWDASPRLSPQLSYNRSRWRLTIMFAAFACMIRPTNAVIWIYLFLNMLWAVRAYPRFLKAVFLDTAAIGFAALSIMFTLDSVYYGGFTLTPLNFLLTNLSSVSLFYGSNTWHYYLSQGIPILLSTALPFTLHGIWSTMLKSGVKNSSVAPTTVLGTIAWTVTIYSFAGHKEWRFLHPLLPLFLLFAAKSLVDLAPKPQPSKPTAEKHTPLLSFVLPPLRRTHLFLIFITLPLSLYVTVLYCDAPITVTSYIRSLPAEDLRGGIGFLTPCHSTPGHAYIHRPTLSHGEMWFLGCEPPLQKQNLATYRDQTDVFFDSPVDYLQKCFPDSVNASFPNSPFPSSIPGGEVVDVPAGPLVSGRCPWKYEWPRRLVFFGALLEQEGVQKLLEALKYKEVWRAGRTWEGEGKRKGAIRVWMWSP